MPRNKTIKKRTHLSNDKTMHTTRNLHEWYQHKFEHLGWMILAKENGHFSKIKEYKKGIIHLKHELGVKISQIVDLDKKRDLEILQNNVQLLLEHVNKEYPY